MRELSLENVWYSYDGAKWVLRGVSLRVAPGRIVVVEGPNGSGKTTLLKVAGGLYRPRRGRVLLDGASLWASEEARRSIVYVHETPIMVRGTVDYNIALGLILRGVPKDKALEEARTAAGLLGITGLLGRDARKISRGQQQLVSLARAIVLSPRYLILDEPTSHLDRRRREAVINLLRELSRKGTGLLIASHDYSLAEIADDSYELVDGVLERL